MTAGRPRRHRRWQLLGLSVLALAPAFPAADGAEPSAGVLAVLVLSNRADLISGGDALVEVAVPDGVDPATVTVDVDGRDVTAALGPRDSGQLVGVVTGLSLGSNVVTARSPGAAAATATIVNHPNGGPVFSGPQIQPWQCQEAATDAQCNQPPTYEFLYRRVDATSATLEPYDVAAPPADVAMTTTDEGVTVPYVVRVETGYQDRDQYKIATLFDPQRPWEPWAPQEQWNHKLLITHGGGCGASYGAGGAPSVLSNGTLPGVDIVLDVPAGVNPTVALGRGFAVLSTALNNNGHNCNLVVQAESMMMAKEHLVEAYGPVRYTIGTGCSGGAVTQQQVANAYPGIYQGLVVTCSYPDTLTPGTQFADYHLLRLYFEEPSRWGPGVLWTPLDWALVEGHATPVNAIAADEGLFKSAVDPSYPCHGVPDEERYHRAARPAGVRCSILDYMINVLGPRLPEAWSPMEQAAGRGFAGAPFGNVGVQYGLATLAAGLITPAQFVDLNAAIGGLDVDALLSPVRTAGDAGALRNAYRSGAVNTGNNLSEVAIINHAGPDPGVAHDAIHAWWMRARILREQGHIGNHVIWFGSVPLIGDPNYYTEAFLAMDRWLRAVEQDGSARPLAEKIVADRPADIRDRCSQVSGVSSPDGLFVPVASTVLDPVLSALLAPLGDVANPVLDPALGVVVDPVLGLVCGPGLVGDLVQTRFGTPRSVAGDGPTSDTNQCSLRPLQRGDYAVSFTGAQWALLVATFPSGVCDWTVPGTGQAGAVTWLTYQDGTGAVVNGGCPLPSPPSGSGGGWASAPFVYEGSPPGEPTCAATVSPVLLASTAAAAAEAVVSAPTARAEGQRPVLPATGRNPGVLVLLALGSYLGAVAWRRRLARL